MTLLWVAAALLTVLAVFLLIRPLTRDEVPAPSLGGDLAVYRAQLSELERDRTRGLIEPGEVEALETEIGRRMLRASRAGGETTAAAPKQSRRLALAVAALVPLGALVVYLAVGHPDMVGMPLAERQVAPGSDPAKVLAAVEQLKAKLKPVKEDFDRWMVVGQAYSSLGRPRDAVDAYRAALAITPDDPTLKAILAESLIAADGGAVGEEAKQLLQAVPDESPAKPPARYYLALAKAQSGDLKGALADWQSLLKESPADASWVDSTKGEIAAASRSLGLDPAQETPPTLPSLPPVPNGAEADAITKMPPEQQMEMIRGMVAKLSAKLEADPDNPAGWRQLAKAYQVLGDPEKGKAAEERATQAEARAKSKATAP
jgi:cytochrome c-type biogenesis protein CcmH